MKYLTILGIVCLRILHYFDKWCTYYYFICFINEKIPNILSKTEVIRKFIYLFTFALSVESEPLCLAAALILTLFRPVRPQWCHTAQRPAIPL